MIENPTWTASYLNDELAGRGVTMGEIQDLGGIKYAVFQDPDGNT